MEILGKVARIFDPQRRFKEQVIEYCSKRGGVIYGDSVLVKLVRFTKKPSVSHLTKEDIYCFRDCLFKQASQYQIQVAMISIRSFLRYYKLKGVICVDPTCIKDNETLEEEYASLCDMKGRTIPKVDRNRELVQLRISDPKMWTWAKLGEKFKIDRARAYHTFNRHALKYIEPQIYKEYKDIIDRRVIHR